MNKLYQILMVIGGAVLAFYCGYGLGQKNQKIQYITKEIEVVKNVTQKRAVIQSRPHITRDYALELMRKNKL